jgi:hypothetical protein
LSDTERHSSCGSYAALRRCPRALQRAACASQVGSDWRQVTSLPSGDEHFWTVAHLGCAPVTPKSLSSGHAIGPTNQFRRRTRPTLVIHIGKGGVCVYLQFFTFVPDIGGPHRCPLCTQFVSLWRTPTSTHTVIVGGIATGRAREGGSGSVSVPMRIRMGLHDTANGNLGSRNHDQTTTGSIFRTTTVRNPT